jgi:hypothetical protein
MGKYFSLKHKKIRLIFVNDNYNLLLKYTLDNNFNGTNLFI